MCNSNITSVVQWRSLRPFTTIELGSTPSSGKKFLLKKILSKNFLPELGVELGSIVVLKV